MPKLTDESIMPFGKHKGIKLANVPANYLIWLYDSQNASGDLLEYIRENMDCLTAEIKRSK